MVQKRHSLRDLKCGQGFDRLFRRFGRRCQQEIQIDLLRRLLLRDHGQQLRRGFVFRGQEIRVVDQLFQKLSRDLHEFRVTFKVLRVFGDPVPQDVEDTHRRGRRDHGLALPHPHLRHDPDCIWSSD